jgi:hypothetical protein
MHMNIKPTTSPDEPEAQLASLVADRDALDARREALNAEIAAAREALRIRSHDWSSVLLRD